MSSCLTDFPLLLFLQSFLSQFPQIAVNDFTQVIEVRARMITVKKKKEDKELTPGLSSMENFRRRIYRDHDSGDPRPQRLQDRYAIEGRPANEDSRSTFIHNASPHDIRSFYRSAHYRH